jgi:hypothetical protein
MAPPGQMNIPTAESDEDDESEDENNRR